MSSLKSPHIGKQFSTNYGPRCWSSVARPLVEEDDEEDILMLLSLRLRTSYGCDFPANIIWV